MKYNVLYIFGGEKASGAEIVLERLMDQNLDVVNPHLFISPGAFADKLIIAKKKYCITQLTRLKKLNRSSVSTLKFSWNALINYFHISVKVYHYIKSNNIHAVHANTIVPASYILPLIIYCKITGTKTKWIWSDHDFIYFSKLDHILSRQCVSLYDKTLVVSNAVAKKYGNSSSVYVLYNGLDTCYFKTDDQLRASFRFSLDLTDEIVIGMPAIISPRKGQLKLITAFVEASKIYPNIKLYFAGNTAADTPEYSQLFLDTVKDHNNVFYLGPFENMVEFYNGVDIVINNSGLKESEPLGTTIYEAMACGKIVAASDTGGNAEIIENNKNGFLFSAGDVEALKGTILHILDNYQNLEDIRRLAKEVVEEKFSIKTMAARYNQLLFN